MSERRRRAFVVASLVCMASLWAQPASAQWVVFDGANVTRQSIIAGIKEKVLAVSEQTQEVLTQMGKRMRDLRTMQDYAVRRIVGWVEVPMSYIRTSVEITSQFMKVLQTGGEFVDSVRRFEVDPRYLATTAVRDALVTLDLADSVLSSGADLAGRIRSLGPEESAAVRRLEQDVLEAADSTTAALDTLSGAALIRARQQETRGQLTTVLVETLVVETLRERQTEATTLRMRAGLAAYHQQVTAGDEEGRAAWADGLRTWRQP
jgi:hypothetical protein